MSNDLTASRVRTRLVNPNGLALTIVLSALAISVNFIGGTAVALLHIPFLYLDTLGTFFIAATFGIRWGVLVGVLTNIVGSLTSGPTDIPYLIVSAAIAVIVGLFANRWGYKLWVAIVAGLVVAVVVPLIGSVITAYVFGGLTGTPIDVVILGFRKAGDNIFVSAFIPQLWQNLVDKLLTALVIFAVIRAIPSSLIKPRRRVAVDAPVDATNTVDAEPQGAVAREETPASV